MSENKRVGRNVAIVLGLLCIIFMGSTVGTVIYYNTEPNGTPDDNQSDTDPSAVYSDLIGQIEAANDTIADLTNQIADLEEQLANIDTTSNSNLAKQVTNLQAQLDIKNKTITQLTDYYNSLIYVLNTEVHDTTALLIAAKDNATALQTEVNILRGITQLKTNTTWINQTVTQNAGASNSWYGNASYAGYLAVTVSSDASAYVKVTYASYGVNYDVQTTVGTSGTAYFPILPANVTVTVGNTLSTGTATLTVKAVCYP